MSRESRRAQSILEYTLIMGAVIAVIVAVLFGSGGIKDKVKGAYDKAGTAVGNTTADLTTGVFK